MVSFQTHIDNHYLYGVCDMGECDKKRAFQFVIFILHVYQYVLRKYCLHTYVIATGVYIYIHPFLVTVPYNPISYPVAIYHDLVS